MYAVKTENLTKFYGTHRGIVDVSLAVEEGDFFGFIGPNGAGKSTTIRSLLGLITPTRGQASLLGKQARSTEARREIGYLPSETWFYSGMRVKDILALSASLRGKDCREEARSLCRRLELDESRRVEELSLGNRKKVGIVCAMQHRPKLYILDEPTSGLDPLIQQTFFELLAERNGQGATVLLSSHVLSEVQRYCRHAVVIREGHILACDSVENLSHTGAKQVSLQGVTTLPALDGIRNVTVGDGGVRFLYSGDPAALLAALGKLPVEDVTITEPSLEEVFLHYYRKEEEA